MWRLARGVLAMLALLATPALAAAADLGTLRIGVLKFGTVSWELDVIKAHGLDQREGFTLEVQPYAGNDAADVALAFCREAAGNCSRWRDGLGWLLYSNLYSYNAVEVEWSIERITFSVNNRKIGPVEVAIPKRLHNVHPKHFRFDLTTDDPLFWIGDAYQTLPIGKFVFMEGDGLHPIKVRHGHAWQCVWMSLFTSMGISGWAQFVERFGMPIPRIEYDSDSAIYGEYKQAMDDILNALGSGKGIKVPKNAGFDLSIVETPQGGRSSDPHSAFWDACKAAKTVRVLGSELGTVTGNVGTYEGPRTGATKYNLEEWDAARLAERSTHRRLRIGHLVEVRQRIEQPPATRRSHDGFVGVDYPGFSVAVGRRRHDLRLGGEGHRPGHHQRHSGDDGSHLGGDAEQLGALVRAAEVGGPRIDRRHVGAGSARAPRGVGMDRLDDLGPGCRVRVVLVAAGGFGDGHGWCLLGCMGHPVVTR